MQNLFCEHIFYLVKVKKILRNINYYLTIVCIQLYNISALKLILLNLFRFTTDALSTSLVLTAADLFALPSPPLICCVIMRNIETHSDTHRSVPCCFVRKLFYAQCYLLAPKKRLITRDIKYLYIYLFCMFSFTSDI